MILFKTSQLAFEFRRDCKGVAVVILAIVLPVLMMTFALAIDGMQAIVLRQKLQTAADATTLAVAKRSALDDQLSANELKAYGVEFLAAQFGGAYQIVSFDVSPADASAKLQLTGTSKALFPKVFDVLALDYTVNSAAAFERVKFEIALVLDNSRSINDAELNGVKSAARELVAELIPTGSSGGNTQSMIAVIPFSGLVRLPESERDQWWIDLDDGSAPNHFDHISAISFLDSRGRTRIWRPTRGELFDQIDDHEWDGCVEHRAYPNNVRDIPATVHNPTTWYLPYFAFDIPDVIDSQLADEKDTAANDWIDDDGGACGFPSPENDFYANVGSTCKYGTPGNPVRSNGKMAIHEGDSFPRGPNYQCTISAMQPLTADRDLLDSAIDAMHNNHINVTDLSIGLIWGWHALTPAAPLEQSTEPVSDNVRKILILMSDGASAAPQSTTKNYGAWGFPGDGRIAPHIDHDSEKEDIRNALNERTLEACGNAKDDGIEVVTINYGESTVGTEVLRQCASKDDYFFEASTSSELAAVLKTVGQSIGSLRLTQ